MKARLIWGFILLAGGALLNSCGKDPAPIAGVSFDVSEEETTESDGTTKSFNPLIITGGVGKNIVVKVLLDKAAPDNLVLSYTVTGTAKRTIDASTGDYNDFNLNGANAKASETLIIEAGATEAAITLTVYEDDSFEIDDNDNLYETVILTFDKVISGSASIGEKNAYTLKINEDDAAAVLQWDSNPATTALDAGDVDMDIFVFLEAKIAAYTNYKDSDFESIIIPGGYPDGTYSVSYTYYSGTANNLKFGVYMFGSSLNAKAYPYPTSALTFSGNYTLANINKYDLTASLPNVKTIQTIVKSKLNFTVSTLTVPSTGSRSGDGLVPSATDFVRMPGKLRLTKFPKL